MTKAFSSHQLDEAWIAIWPEHFGAAHFLKGVDVDALARDYEALTCRPLARP